MPTGSGKRGDYFGLGGAARCVFRGCAGDLDCVASRLRFAGLELFEFFFELLLADEVGVVAAVGEEFGVGALFGDFTSFEDHDAVGVADGGDTVGDQKRRAAAHDLGEFS